MDGLSDDGVFGLTVIAFVGSVFSPYYAWRRRGGQSNPLEHCALNVALYGPKVRRWSMTERGSTRIGRSTDELSIGASRLRWKDGALEIAIDEVCAPIPRRVRGTVRLVPHSMGQYAFDLDAAGRHSWTPIAPCARIEASFSHPDLSWSGVGYADCNRGDEPLEEAFSRWTWSRSSPRSGRTAKSGASAAVNEAGPNSVVLYDVTARDRSNSTLALLFEADGSMRTLEPPPPSPLPSTGWRVARHTRADAGSAARVMATLEDGPFYSRSLIDTQVNGERAVAVHESLNLDRFRRYWVQSLLPFRMPRGLR